MQLSHICHIELLAELLLDLFYVFHIGARDHNVVHVDSQQSDPTILVLVIKTCVEHTLSESKRLDKLI
jgi:hypothetical protein